MSLSPSLQDVVVTRRDANGVIQRCYDTNFCNGVTTSFTAPTCDPMVQVARDLSPTNLPIVGIVREMEVGDGRAVAIVELG